MKQEQNDEDVIYIKPIHLFVSIIIVAIIGFGVYSYVQTLDDFDYIFVTSYKYDSIKITMVDGETIPLEQLTVYCDGQKIDFDLYNSNHKKVKEYSVDCYLLIDESYYDDYSVIEIHRLWNQILQVTI